MLPTMEQADGWVERAIKVSPADAQLVLWKQSAALVRLDELSHRMARVGVYAEWLGMACWLLKAQGQRIILTDYPAQDVPWHVLGMQLTAAACVGEVASACGELLKWCDKNGVPLCEAMEGI
jgi:hypothetical protein